MHGATEQRSQPRPWAPVLAVRRTGPDPLQSGDLFQTGRSRYMLKDYMSHGVEGARHSRIDAQLPGFPERFTADYFVEMNERARTCFGVEAFVALTAVEIFDDYVRVWCAANPAPIVVRADGQIERLECGGMPIGILGSDLYCAPSFAEFKPQPGDSLVLATDGFFDQRGDDGSRFAKKIVDILARRASLATGIKSLWDAFRAHTANVEIEDDVTVALLSFVNDASSRLAA